MMAGNMKDTSALNRKRHEASLSRWSKHICLLANCSNCTQQY
jgi:hypothetical protein